MEFILGFVIVAFVFAVIDAIWLKLSSGFYKREIGGLLLEKPNFRAAIIFYAIYVIGIVVFAVMPALNGNSWVVAVGYGALLGLVAYATYDLTNLATLKNWSQKVVIIDMLWGTVVTALSATVAYLSLSSWFGL